MSERDQLGEGIDVEALTAMLAPCLPFLVQTGTAATEHVSEQLGEEVWPHGTRLWDRLRPAVEGNPAAQEAVGDLAINPDDPIARTALVWQLRKLLEG